MSKKIAATVAGLSAFVVPALAAAAEEAGANAFMERFFAAKGVLFEDEGVSAAGH